MNSLVLRFLRKGWLTMTILLLATPQGVRELTRTYRDHAQAPAHWHSIPDSDALGAYGELPLSFEANKGQAHPDIKFVSHGNHLNLLLTNAGALFLPAGSATREPGKPHRPEEVRMELASANPSPRISGFDQLPNKSSYFVGSDSARWVTGIPNYAGVHYADVYPGVDLLYYGNGQQFEYDFILSPGSEPRVIKLSFHGAEKMSLNEDGSLVLKTAAGEIRHHKPSVYQKVGGLKRVVRAQYVITNENLVSFDLGEYDVSQPLVIDPILEYSTYIGGASRDEGNAIAVDSSGNIYIAGFTDSPGSLMTPNATGPGTSPINSFVIKLSADGASVLYSVHLADCEAFSLAVDSGGNVYLAGQAGPDLPVTPGAFQTVAAGGFDVFAAKLDPTGSSLIYSTFVGGSNDDSALDIAVDGTGNAFLCGETQSADFPTTSHALQQALAGGSFDAFALKLNAAGTALNYATYLGGKNNDRGQGIALDSAGNAYVTGASDSGNFPTTEGAYDGSNLEFFLTKLNQDGSAELYSVYGLGGRRIVVDPEGNAYVTGTTRSKQLETTRKAFQRSRQGNLDAFVAKLNQTGTDVIYATYLGGTDNDYGSAIGIDLEGHAYVAGSTESGDFPAVHSLQPSYAGFTDMFVAELSTDGTAVLYSTLVGGGDTDLGEAITVLPQGVIYATGSTRSLGFPTANPLQAARGGGNEFDAFVVRIDPTSFDPRIDSVQVVDKSLFIYGENFDFGAKILIDGKKAPTENDVNEPATTLFSNAARKRIINGEADTVTLQVRNSDGKLSNEFIFTRPAQ
jgi:Beta-propeller repeat